MTFEAETPVLPEQSLGGVYLGIESGIFSEAFESALDIEIGSAEAKIWALLPFPYIGAVAKELWGPFAKYLRTSFPIQPLRFARASAAASRALALDDAALIRL